MNIFPQALINYIILNGGGFDWDASLEKSHSMDELIEAVCIRIDFLLIKFSLSSTQLIEFLSHQFDITKVDNYASRLQITDLEKCNKFEIQRQINDPILIDRLVEQARELIKSSFPTQ